MAVKKIYEPHEWAVLVATGPTLTDDDARLVDKYRRHVWLLGCNDAYRMFPDLNVLYACDPQWWNYHGEACRRLPAQKWTQDEGAATAHKLNHIPGEYEVNLSTNADKIHFGNNSGYQLINLAYLMGIRHMMLIGYTMRVTLATGEKKQHFFGPHPAAMRNIGDYTQFVSQFNTIKVKDLEIINCTPESAVNCFPKETLEAVLERVAGSPKKL